MGMATSRIGIISSAAIGIGIGIFLGVATSGCVVHLGDERAGIARPTDGTVAGDCVVPRPARLSSWGAPVSLDWPDGSLWIFPSVQTADGTEIRAAAAWVPSVEAACAGALEWRIDSNGELASLVVLTAEEQAANAARTDGRRVALSVTGGFVHGDRAALYYESQLVGPGLFDLARRGTGLCRLDGRDAGACTRARPTVVDGDPTLLWGADARRWNQGALVAGDGYVYLYGCQQVAAFTHPCALARVRPDEAADPAAYVFRGAFDPWVTDPWNAAALLDSAGALTIAPSPAHRRLLLVDADIWTPSLRARLVEAPWGPFPSPAPLAPAIAPKTFFIDGGRLHPGLARDGGRRIALSYATRTDGAPEGRDGLHLITFQFAQPAEVN